MSDSNNETNDDNTQKNKPTVTSEVTNTETNITNGESNGERSDETEDSKSDAPAKIVPVTKEEPKKSNNSVLKDNETDQKQENTVTKKQNNEVVSEENAKIELEESSISKFVERDDVPLDWVKAQQEKTIANMRHMVVLSVLQEPQYSAEREHFYNEVHKRHGQNIESAADAEYFIAKVLSCRDSESLLRDTAPGAVSASNEYIQSIDIDKTFQDVGYPKDRISPEFRENMQITQAYANRIGGEEGEKSFLTALKSQKDNFIKALGEPKVGLAVSGSLFAMSVMAGTGPAGLVIGSLKVAQKLLETKKGKEFQEGFYSSAISFMDKIGVNPELLKNVSNSAKDVWNKTTGTRWGKVAMYGAAAFALTTFGHSPSAAEMPFGKDSVFAHIPTPELPDIKVLEAPDFASTIPDETPTPVPADRASPGTNIPDANEPVVNTPDAIVAIDHAYDVKQGDTLWNIAKEAYTAAHPGEAPNTIQIINMVNEIAEHNQIDNPNMIYSGQTIHVPGGMNPSNDLVAGPTDWLKEQAPSLNDRIASLEERVDDWRQDHSVEEQDRPSHLRGKYMRM